MTSDRTRGFTLIELALVLLIIGLMVSFAVPRLTDLTETRLTASARRLAAVISYLHDEAAFRGRIYRLSLDLNHASYSIDVRAPYAQGRIAEELAAAWDPYTASVQLPEGIRIASVSTSSEQSLGGQTDLYFLPEDAVEGWTITLETAGGRQAEVGVEAVTGRTKVVVSGPNR